jgi:hypothetical protein
VSWRLGCSHHVRAIASTVEVQLLPVATGLVDYLGGGSIAGGNNRQNRRIVRGGLIVEERNVEARLAKSKHARQGERTHLSTLRNWKETRLRGANNMRVAVNEERRRRAGPGASVREVHLKVLQILLERDGVQRRALDLVSDRDVDLLYGDVPLQISDGGDHN